MTKAEAERSGSAATHDDSSLGIGHSSLIRHSGFDIRHSTDARVVLASVLLFSAISLALNVTSSGFLEADGITHYLYARWAIAEPHLLTNVWGRPFVTAIHALPAQLPGTFLGQPWGLIGVRAASMLLAVGSALIAWRVAVGQGPAYGHDRPGLAALFLLCMPLVILHSISELTELPFAFLAILALWAYQKRAWWLLALAAGLLPAARPEGFGFALLAVGGLVLHRRWEVLILPLPVIAWDRLGWWQYGHEAPGAWWHLFRWLAANWPYSGESAYKPGPLLKFVGMLPAVVGPLIMPMLIVGIIAAVFTRRQGPDDEPRPAWRDHHVRVAWLIAFVPLLVLVVHSLLHWRGKMASSGEIRYLACVAPFWALLAARGWDELSRRLRWRWDYLLAAVAAVGPVLAMQLYYPIVPLEADVPGREAVEVARWYEQSELSRTHPRLMSDHPIIWYTLDLNPQKKGGGKDRIREPEPGSTFLWHDIYSTHNADDRYIVPADLPPQHGWREVTPGDFRQGWRVFAIP